METQTLIVVLLMVLIFLVAGVFVFNRRAPASVQSAVYTLDDLERKIADIQRERKGEREEYERERKMDRDERERERRNERAEKEQMRSDLKELQVKLDSCLEVKEKFSQMIDSLNKRLATGGDLSIGIENNLASPKTTHQHFPAPNPPKQ